MFSRAEAKFWGLANRIAEEQFAATFDDDPENTLLRMLYAEYSAATEILPADAWLSLRIKELFRCHGNLPQWITGPQWPFHDHLPMTFIGQLSVDQSEVSSTRLTENSKLFVFGCRVQKKEGWEMHYRVVEQCYDLIIHRRSSGGDSE